MSLSASASAWAERTRSAIERRCEHSLVPVTWRRFAWTLLGCLAGNTVALLVIVALDHDADWPSDAPIGTLVGGLHLLGGTLGWLHATRGEARGGNVHLWVFLVILGGASTTAFDELHERLGQARSRAWLARAWQESEVAPRTYDFTVGRERLEASLPEGWSLLRVEPQLLRVRAPFTGTGDTRETRMWELRTDGTWNPSSTYRLVATPEGRTLYWEPVRR